MTQKLTRKVGSHFPFASHALPTILVGAGGGSGRRSRDPEVDEKSWLQPASDARPLLQACPIGPQPDSTLEAREQARSVPSPSSSG